MPKRALRRKLPPVSSRKPDRRQMLGGLAGVGIAAASGLGASAKTQGKGGFDAALQDKIRNVVVIFAENRSFNNLFSNFPGLQHPLSAVPRERFQQRDRDGSLLASLPPIWGGLVPTEQVLESGRYQIGQEAITALPNGHFALQTPEGHPLPHGLVTRDLAHAVLSQSDADQWRTQRQLCRLGRQRRAGDGPLCRHGRPDCGSPISRATSRCATISLWARSAALFSITNIWSRPNRLIYPDADKTPAAKIYRGTGGQRPHGHAAETARRFAGQRPGWAAAIRFQQSDPRFLGGEHDVSAPIRPPRATISSPLRLPPQIHKTIGDVLSDKGVDWAWYAGAWQATLDGQAGQADSFPPKPEFPDPSPAIELLRQLCARHRRRARLCAMAGWAVSPETNA